jgi:hypothetical protein
VSQTSGQKVVIINWNSIAVRYIFTRDLAQDEIIPFKGGENQSGTPL